jgi:peptidoglycan L-alanyl-D-glutamate endopeptidase CwlK
MGFDAKTETHLDLLYPAFSLAVRRTLLRAEETTGRSMKITEALRSFSRQAALFAQGRTAPGAGASSESPLGRTVTNAQAGLSTHHYGLACDCAFHGADPYLDAEIPAVRNRAWDLFGAAAVDEGLTWGGGNWGGPHDRPHLEALYGFRIGDIRGMFDRFACIAGLWERIDVSRGVEPGMEWRGRILFDPTK